MSTTISTLVTPIIEIYPFASSIPSVDDFNSDPSQAMPLPGLIIASLQSEQVQDLIDLSEMFSGENKAKISFGLKNLTVSRSKSNPSSPATFSLIGPVPEGVYPGAWVIISTISDKGVDSSYKSTRMVRYIGQIHTIEPMYSADNTGLISLTTNVHLREWSSILTVPIRFDAYSIYHSMSGMTQASAIISSQLSIAGSETPAVPRPTFEEIMTSSQDPFQVAHNILAMVSCISDNDSFGVMKSHISEANAISIAPPKIPQSVLNRIGVSSSGNLHPYSSGFVDVITGILRDPFFNDGEWNGIFDDSGRTSISGFKSRMKSGWDQFGDKKPGTVGSNALLQLGESAWDLLNEHCENCVNEIYTDLLFQKDTRSTSSSRYEEIISKPVIMVRDKPFLIYALKDLPQGQNSDVFDKWTLFDFLPRVRIASEKIISAAFQNTFINSPNYFRINVSLTNSSEFVNNAVSSATNFTRLSAEQSRFGGNHFFANTQYISNGGELSDGTGSLNVLSSSFQGLQGGAPTGIIENAYITDQTIPLQEWYRSVKDLLRFWHAYDYRLASGVLVLKDDNLAITVGLNVQFQIGEYYELVGHVESVSYDFSVDEFGSEISLTKIQLSRILRVVERKLEFVPMEDWGRLMTIKMPPPATPTSTLNYINIFSGFA